MSNLKQIGLSATLYCHDHEDEFPGSRIVVPSGEHYSQFFWVGKKGTGSPYNEVDASQRFLNSYLGFYAPTSQVEVAHCPSDSSSTLGSYDYYGSSYANNVHPNASFRTLGIGNGRACKSSQIRNASKMVTISEGGAFFPPWHPVEIPKQFFVHTKVNDTRWNVAFTDGHAAFTHIHYLEGVPTMSGPDYTFDRTKQ